MSRHDSVVRLKHMRDAALAAVEMVADRARHDLDTDGMLEPALKYQMLRNEGAAYRFPQAVMRRSPQTPWSQIIGMRHVIVRGYDVVDHHVVWQAATVDIPELLRPLQAPIAALEEDDRAGS
ncbi:MAG: DUF86 domain-containing protein [Armatimonadota bacterium]